MINNVMIVKNIKKEPEVVIIILLSIPYDSNKLFTGSVYLNSSISENNSSPENTSILANSTSNLKYIERIADLLKLIKEAKKIT